MAGSRETPRQRMISMMYLVLTALLALNVSKEVVDAFLVVNESVEQSNEKLSDKISNIYGLFETMYKLNQVEVQSFWERAQQAKTLSKEMLEYLSTVKNEVVSKTEGISMEEAGRALLRNLKKKDNYSITTEYFMGDSHDGSSGKSKELRLKIEAYKKQMIALVDPSSRDKLKLGLVTDSTYFNADGQKQNWEAHHFYHTILAADITILNKFISEVHDTEYEIVGLLMDEINASDFSYDKIEAKVLSKSNYIFYGDEYEAEVIVAAYDTSQVPKVYLMENVDELKYNQIKNSKALESKIGKTSIKLPANKTGLNKYAGLIGVTTGTGDVNYFPFSDQYFVAKPSLSISVDEMNVLYIGVQNTISVAVSGIPKEKLLLDISHGTISEKQNGDKWIVEVPPGENYSKITVKAEINGELRNMGSQRFRIKRLPDPVASIANKKEGYVDRRILIAAGAIVPKMPMDFGFDLYFKIKSFRMTIQRGFNVYHFTAENGLLTDEMIEQIELTNRGQNLLFENIVAVGPYGDERLLSPIILTIK